jgi:argininosuccinate lyase
VGHDIENGAFKPDTNIQHTHEGSIGNLCTEEIRAQMEAVIKQFPFEKVHQAIAALVK